MEQLFGLGSNLTPITALIMIFGILGAVLFFFSFVEVGPVKIEDRYKTSARIYGIVALLIALIVLVTSGSQPAAQQPLVSVPIYVGPPSALTPSPPSEPIEEPSVPTSLPDTPVVAATPTTPAAPIAPTPELALPSPTTANTPSPIVTNTPEPIINVVAVPGYAEQGVRIDIPASGTYRLEYIGNAYSPWPTDTHQDYRGWTSMLNVYVNRPVEWGQTPFGLVGPINQDHFIGPGEYRLNKEEVIARARGNGITLPLNMGDYLILIPIDERGQYGDNRDQVEMGITLVSP